MNVSEKAVMNQLREEMTQIADTRFKVLFGQWASANSIKLTRADKSNEVEASDAVDLIQDERKIEEIILANTKHGDEFYPTDIAFEFGLDLKTTMKVVQKLVERGVVDE